ncbi:invasion associated locus B family protein [Limimaricola sp.]|uniref:invasion associated locus B family protein n=1 Tax=Limimaricola sp. TaxID=2211665 RepID=UPI0025BB82AB|nr:invasion associated locus B family protein [Limimaricola sp.]
MISSFSRAVAFSVILATAGLTAGIAQAQSGDQSTGQSSNRVAADTDWSVFVDQNPTECWAVSAPKQTVNTKDGKPVSVRRGDIRLFVFYRPSENVSGQVAFTGGYPFASGSTVTVDVGGTKFQLFTQGEWAWPATPQDDATIATAMKSGATAVVTGLSGRGTQTEDTFSLLGFTAAIEEAAKRCAN